MPLPALVFPFVVSRLGRLRQFDRTLRALQRGLGPVALGLMASTCFLLIRETPGLWKGGIITALSLALFATTRLPPVLMILAAGIAGIFIPW